MKKFLFSFIFLSKFVFCAACSNPQSPKIIKEGFFISPANFFNFRLGYEGDFVSNRRLIQKHSTPKRVNDFKEYLNSFSCIFNIFNRMDIFGSVGQARIKADWLIEDEANAFSYIELETEYDTSWAVAIKTIFFEWGDTTLSLGGKYSYTKPEISWFAKNGQSFSMQDYDVTFYQWQIDVGLAYKIEMFIPYLSFKYSKAKAKLAVDNIAISSDGSSAVFLKSKNNFGMVLGTALSSGKYFLLNAEIRMVDEEAFSVSGEFRF